MNRYLEGNRPLWAAQSPMNRPQVLIFHCEYSKERGPKMYDLLRLADRHCNQYPHLHYPEMYLLDQGYNKFFETPGAVSFLLFGFLKNFNFSFNLLIVLV